MGLSVEKWAETLLGQLGGLSDPKKKLFDKITILNYRIRQSEAKNPFFFSHLSSQTDAHGMAMLLLFINNYILIIFKNNYINTNYIIRIWESNIFSN